MLEHTRNDDHPRGPESARVARDRKRDARRHHCDVAQPDWASEFCRLETLTSKLTQTPKTELDEKRRAANSDAA